jgi:DMSO/TMAO reductase YedYZ molybdopterin-dependent catalytic subunit
LSSLLEHLGADLRGKYGAFKMTDGYLSSIQMVAVALRPQVLLATRRGENTLADPFGCPVRLRAATKIDYKNPKDIIAIEVTNGYRGGWRESRGFPWFAGIWVVWRDSASWLIGRADRHRRCVRCTDSDDVSRQV